MTSTIFGFNQNYLIKLNLTTDDALILKWLSNFIASGKQETISENGEIYYWVKYSKLLDDLPILKTKNPKQIIKTVKRLCGIDSKNENLYPLKKITKYLPNKLGRKTYISFRKENYDLLYNNIQRDIAQETKATEKKSDTLKRKATLNKNVFKIIKHLSTKTKPDGSKLFSNTLPKDEKHYTKGLEKFQSMLYDLYEGKWIKNYKNQIAEWFITKNKFYIDELKIRELLVSCKGSWKNIYSLMDEVSKRYSKWFEINRGFDNKESLPKSMQEFMFSNHSEVSMFYICLLKNPTRIREYHAENCFNKIKPEIREIFLGTSKHFDGATFWNKIYNMQKYYKKYADELVNMDTNCINLFSNRKTFFNEYNKWIETKTDNQPNINNFGIGNKTFAWFLKEKQKEYGIDHYLPEK